MINNNYELVLGLYLGLIAFFLGYFSLGDYKENIMKNIPLNLIFITFFIVLFFLLGYIFQNILLSFTDIKKVDNKMILNTASKEFKDKAQ